jgi:hypothetical protein
MARWKTPIWEIVGQLENVLAEDVPLSATVNVANNRPFLAVVSDELATAQ